MSQLQDTLDDQKSKSLDQRERDLVEREKLLDDSARLVHIEELEATIDVLDSQIEIKDATKDNLDKQIERLRKSVIDEQTRTDIGISGLKKTISKYQDDLNLLVTKRERVEEEIAGFNHDLKLIRDDIKNQNQYLKEQEESVNNAISEWNIQLNDLHAEAEKIDLQKKAAASQITVLIQQQQEMETTLEFSAQKAQQLTEAYENKKHQYAEELSVIKQEKLNEETSLSQLNVNLQKRIKDLDTKEQSLKIKKSSLINLENDLAEREERLQMRLGMLS